MDKEHIIFRNERGQFAKEVQKPLVEPLATPQATITHVSHDDRIETIRTELSQIQDLVPTLLGTPPTEIKLPEMTGGDTPMGILAGKVNKQRELNTPKVEPSTPRHTVDLLPNVEFPVRESILPSFAEHIVWLREQQARVERLSKSSEYAEIKIHSEQPIGIVLSSDWHIGSDATDYETFEKHMKMVKEDPFMYLTALSNTIDGYIWPGGMWSEIAHIPEQMEIAKQFAHEYKDKLLAVVGSRCHDWTKDKGGVSPQEQSFLENVDDGMPFFTNGGMLTVDLNGIKYKIGMQHKSRFHSALNVTNANKRTLDLRWPSADVVAIAHHHVASVEHTARWEGPDKRDVVLVRTGTYKIEDGYSKSEGFGAGQLGAPMIVLDPKEKRIIPFLHIEDGAKYLKSLRG